MYELVYIHATYGNIEPDDKAYIIAYSPKLLIRPYHIKPANNSMNTLLLQYLHNKVSIGILIDYIEDNPDQLQNCTPLQHYELVNTLCNQYKNPLQLHYDPTRL